MYGYFECDDCNNRWESAHVYKKGNGRFYGQECRDCGTMCHPYRTEETICSVCGKAARTCNCVKANDPNKPHRSELCEKCRSGRPCQRL